MADNKVIIELLLANNQYLAQLAASRKKTEDFAKSATNSFGGFGKFLTGAVVLGALYKIKTETDEFQKSQAKLNAVIASTGGAAGVTAEAATKLAQKLSGVTAVDDDLIVSAESVLLRFRTMSKDIFPAATQAALDLSAATGKDLNSAALLVGRSLSGQEQSLTALSRSGVLFTNIQKDQYKQMVKVGNIAGANKIVLAQLDKSFGGQAAATANTLDGALSRIKISLGNMAAIIGDEATPGIALLSREFAKATESGGLFESVARRIGKELRLAAVDITAMGKELSYLKEYFKPLWDATFGEGQKSINEYAKSLQKAKDELSKFYIEAQKIKDNIVTTPAKKLGGIMPRSDVDSETGLDAKETKRRQKITQMFGQIKSELTDFGNNVNSLFETISDGAIRALETKRTIISALFDHMEQRALQSAGVQEQTAVQANEKEIVNLQKQISKTGNLQQKKALRETLVEKQKENTRLKIQEDADKRQQVLQSLMDVFEMQMKRRQFERNKAYQLSMVWINTAAAIAAAWLSAWTLGFPPAAIAMGIISTALLLANAAVQTAIISRQQAPAFQEGSWDVQHTGSALLHGGEIVTPKPIADSIRSGEAYLGGGQSGDIVMVMDGRQVGKVVRDRNSRFGRSIGGKSFSMAGAY